MSGAVHLDGVRPGGRVVVAMSGGVDSSVAAALLAEAGYDVVGITLQLYDHGAAIQKKGACCAGQDIHDARAVADRIGIPHYVLDYEQRFRDDVIERFADSYAAGETPVPCIACNQTVKFRDLLGTARELGAEAMATGHYVRRLVGAEGPEMHRAVDPARDQSYFLFATTAEQLAFLRFPLGGMPKAETRAHAERLGLAIAAKPDSQDICFVPSGRYAGIVERLRPDAHKAGEIVHLDGRVLGTHAGIAHFTIGQRRGIGVGGEAAGGDPLYVVRLDAGQARVLVGPREALARDTIHLRDLNLLGSVPAGGLDLSVKLRSVQAPAAARLVGSTVTLAEPQYGISPGQACVFYRGDRVLGGGWIAATDRAALAAA